MHYLLNNIPAKFFTRINLAFLLVHSYPCSSFPLKTCLLDTRMFFSTSVSDYIKQNASRSSQTNENSDDDSFHMKLCWFIMYFNAFGTFQLPVSFLTTWQCLKKALRRKNFSCRLPCMYIFKSLCRSIFDIRKGVHT